MKIPELESQLQLGDEFLFVYEIDEGGSSHTGFNQVPTRDDRIVLTCHDNNGNEVEIRFYPDDEEDDYPEMRLRVSESGHSYYA